MKRVKRIGRTGFRGVTVRERYGAIPLVGVAAGGLLFGSIAGGFVDASAASLPKDVPGDITSLINQPIASVVAPNGDGNPFGIAMVPLTLGKMVKGDILVADFGNSAGSLPGGTSILQINPHTGQTTVFYSGVPVAGPVGLAINPVNDAVWVGDYGSAQDGTAANDLVITASGALLDNFNDSSTSDAASFLGVWGQGVSQAAGEVSFYFGNAGNATTGAGGGDVWRIDPHPTGPKNGQPLNSTYVQIAAGQAQTSAGGNAASAAGPQGLIYDSATGNMYETNDASNAIYAIPNAATATGPQTPQLIYQGPALASPENIAVDPVNGDLLIVNAGNNNLVEITPAGQVVASVDLAPGQPVGALFGLAAGKAPDGSLVVYYTNIDTNTLDELVASSHIGYRLVASDGGVFTFGHASYQGSLGGTQLNRPVVGMATTPDGQGYWQTAADGGVFAFGDATFQGSQGATHLNAPVVGMAATPNGQGYWLAAADGGVFAFGAAMYHGSEGGAHLNASVVGIATTPDGQGYWLATSDGGVFTFGDATFYGSEGSTHLNAPVVGIATTPDGQGYWLATSDGGVFAFGDATFFGSEGGSQLNAPAVGITVTTDGQGYWLAASDGGVFAFGDATFNGSEGGVSLNAPVVGATN